MSLLNYIIAFLFVLLRGGSGPPARPKQRQRTSCRGRRRRDEGDEKRLCFSSAAGRAFSLDVCEGSSCFQRTALKSNSAQKRKKVCFLHGELEYQRSSSCFPWGSKTCSTMIHVGTNQLQINLISQNQTKGGYFQDPSDRKYEWNDPSIFLNHFTNQGCSGTWCFFFFFSAACIFDHSHLLQNVTT